MTARWRRCSTTALPELRESLLTVNGVGPETADSILLYAGGLPTFVVDAYTHRVLARHGWIGFDADYHQIQDYFEGGLPQDVALYNEYHALVVRVGKGLPQDSRDARTARWPSCCRRRPAGARIRIALPGAA